MLRRALIAALAALAPVAALAQGSILQGGAWTPGHAPMYVGQGSSQAVVQDSGPAAGGGNGVGLSELNVTARGAGTGPYAGLGTGPFGTVNCTYDNFTGSANYHYICLSANAQGGALIAVGAGGTASALPLSFIVNGTTYAFPFSSGGIVGPGTTVVNDVACWNNTVGTLLKDCGAAVSTSSNNIWTGTNNFTGPFQVSGTPQTFPASGTIVGTSDAQTLTNKSINASEVNSGTLSGVVMPAFTGDVTNPAGSLATTISAGVVTNAKLAVAAQNTVKGAAVSTAIADLAVPSCSAGGSALQWTTNTGFGCATLTGQTAGWGLTGTSTFSISTTAPPFPFDFPVNMGLSASVGASALTINLTTANGAAPSATNPVLVPFRSTTVATGTTVWAAITSALSITIPSAATLGTTNSVPFRIWVALEYNAGVPELVVATCSGANTIYPCAGWESGVTTTTTISGFATAGGTPYATTGVASDAIRLIGYATYSSGLATAGVWSGVPTSLHVLGPGHKKPGDVVQTVSLSTQTQSSSSSSTPAATSVHNSFTLSSSVNGVKVTYSGMMGSGGNADFATLALYRGNNACTTQIGPKTAIVNNANVALGVPIGASWLDTPASGSTTAAAYTVCTSSPSGGVTSFFPYEPGAGLSTGVLTLEEIMGALEPANDHGPLSLVG